MSMIITNLCSYTRLGLTGHLLSRGVKKGEIDDIKTVDDLAIACDSQYPPMVFINGDCFIRDASNSQHTRHIINQHPDMSFTAFMVVANVHSDEYLLVRKNLLISFKPVKPESSDDIPGDILKEEIIVISFLNMPMLSLSRTKSSMLRTQMAG